MVYSLHIKFWRCCTRTHLRNLNKFLSLFFSFSISEVIDENNFVCTLLFYDLCMYGDVRYLKYTCLYLIAPSCW